MADFPSARADGRKKIVHVNQHAIRRNAKHGTNEPPLRVKVGKRNVPAMEVGVLGPSWVVYRPTRPLSCGARVWIESRAKVIATLASGEEIEL